jgi:Xaa-Pro dipeptidase
MNILAGIDYEGRIQRCQQEMDRKGYDRLLISTAVNLFYFTGTWVEPGERLLTYILPRTGAPEMIVHRMFQHEVSGIQDVEITFWKDGEDAMDLLAARIAAGETVGIDRNWPSFFLIDLMSRNRDAQWKSAGPVVDALRRIKTPDEIAVLRASAAKADRVMERIARASHFPSTEKALERMLADFFMEEGVDRFSFDPIIGFGEHSAVPHHATSNQMSSAEHAVLIDMGGRYLEYCSDMTRTYYLGEPNERFKEIYSIVLEAQLAATASVKPGVSASDIDRAARSVIEKAGYGEYFTHRTGHGLGIEVHEEPYIHGKNDQVLEEGMVFSIEPGIYIPGEFGVRIEDIVVVTKDGVEVFNQAPKELTYLK